MANKNDHLLIGALAAMLLYMVLKVSEGYGRYKNTEEHRICQGFNEAPLDRFLRQFGGAVANIDFDIAEFLGSGAVGALAAMIPDVLEPATNPNHREFFHSYTLLITTLATELNILDKVQANYLLKLLSLAAAGGYSSHLLVDSCTPKGLPVF